MKLAKQISIALLAACVVGGSAVAMTACGANPPIFDNTADIGENFETVSACLESAHMGAVRQTIEERLLFDLSFIRTDHGFDFNGEMKATDNTFFYTVVIDGIPSEETCDKIADDFHASASLTETGRWICDLLDDFVEANGIAAHISIYDRGGSYIAGNIFA